MKIDFSNYEITMADGLEVFYASDDAKCKREDKAECKDDIKAKCREWLKGKKKEDIKKMMEEKDASIEEDMMNILREIDDDEMEEMCSANIFMNPVSPIATLDEMIKEVNWGFKPVVGSFTVGHSLLRFGEKNLNNDNIMPNSIDYYLNAIAGQACTWEHEMDILIGSVMNATVHFPTNTLLLNTRFWEARPECSGFVEEVKQRYNAKNLKFSFEVMTAKVACSECGNEYPARVNGKTDHYCSHLKSRYEAGSQVSRILVDFIPIGEGVVSTPAFGESKALIAANKTEVARLAQAVDELNKLIKSKLR